MMEVLFSAAICPKKPKCMAITIHWFPCYENYSLVLNSMLFLNVCLRVISTPRGHCVQVSLGHEVILLEGLPFTAPANNTGRKVVHNTRQDRFVD